MRRAHGCPTRRPDCVTPRGSGSYDRIYAVVRQIPEGRVATYGQVAALAGLPGHARQVGYALSALSADGTVPWHRVINAEGRVSPRSEPGYDGYQRHLLQGEGVRFDRHGRVSLSEFRWRPEERSGERLWGRGS